MLQGECGSWHNSICIGAIITKMAQNIQLTEWNTPQRYRNVFMIFLEKALVDYFILLLLKLHVWHFYSFRLILFVCCKRKRHSRDVLHAFFIKNTLISKTRLKSAKNQTKSNHHLETEIWLFEIYLLPSSTLSSKSNGRYSKKYTKRSVSMG